MDPHQPGQLLHIRGVVVHPLADFFGQGLRNAFARGRKTLADILNPIGRAYFVQVDGVTEFVERKALLFEEFVHQVLLAPERAVRHRFLQLPYGTEPFLKGLGVVELGNLLKFVDTDYDLALLFWAILSGSCRISSISSLLGFISSDTEKSDIGSGPMVILGLMRERNSLAFSTHSSHLEEVCLRMAAAKAS